MTRVAPKPRISMAAIHRYARKIAEQFHPDKIYLFGSYAYGTPRADSDVDLLVIMPARNAIDQAVKIDWELSPPFSTDLLVFTPYHFGWRLRDRESFVMEIVTRGKVLYEKNDAGMGAKSRRRLASRRNARRKHRTGA